MHLLEPSIYELAEAMDWVSSWTDEQKKSIWRQTYSYAVKNYPRLPTWLFFITDRDKKLELGHDRNFCRMIGIPYPYFDYYWDNLRACIAYCYAKQIEPLRQIVGLEKDNPCNYIFNHAA